MADAPLASVIVLGYWGREFVDGCLSSLLDQDLPDDQYEVLYIDNGSRDRCGEFVRKAYSLVRVLTLERNVGYAEGNNVGFRNTTGSVVVFLNEDTVVHRSWLRELVEAICSSPQIAAGHANIIQPWYPEYSGIEMRAASPAAYTSEVNRLGYIGYRRLPSTDRLYDTLFLHGVCIAVRRSVGEDLGYVFDPAFFAYAEDLDLGLRVRALGYRSVAVPRAVVYHKHRLQTNFSWRTVTKTVRIIRNRYLAFYKVMSGWEFALMVPLMTIGAPFNALEFGLSRTRQVLYGLALAPATLLALAMAIASLPNYAAKRRLVREQAASNRSWCLRALWTRGAVTQ